MSTNATTISPCDLTRSMAKEEAFYTNTVLVTVHVWQPIIIVLGLIGSFLIILVMTRRSYRDISCANYIAVLAISDSVALLRKSVDLFQLLADVGYTDTGCKAWVYIALTACQYSTFLIVLMTVDRLILVRFPKYSSYCRPQIARKVMIAFLIIAILFNIPHLFLSKGKDPLESGAEVYKFCAALQTPKNETANYEAQVRIYGTLQVIVNFVLPFIALIAMTAAIIFALRRNRKMQNELEGNSREFRSSLSNNVIIKIVNIGLFHVVIPRMMRSFLERTERKQTKLDGTVNRAFTSEQEVVQGNMDAVFEGDKTPGSKADDKRTDPEEIGAISGMADDNYNRPNSAEGGFGTRGRTFVDNGVPLRRKSSTRSWTNPEEEESQINEEEITTISRSPNNTPLQSTVSRQVSEHRRDRDGQLSLLLILVVVMFLLLCSMQFIRYLMYFPGHLDPCSSIDSYLTSNLVYHVSNKLYFTNCAINFYIYIFGSSLFRNSLKSVFTKCWRRCRRRKSKDNKGVVITVDMGVQAQEEQGVMGRSVTISTQTDPVLITPLQITDEHNQENESYMTRV